MERLSRGWRFAKLSLAVVRRDPALVTLAVIGIVLAAVLAVLPLVGAAAAFDSDQEILGYVLLGVTMFAFSLATTYVGVAIALAAATVLDGGDATVGRSLAGATSRFGPILGWAIVGTAVNIVFALLRDRGGIAGTVLASVGSAAWSLVTFLAVPVIAFEGLGPFATLKRSAALFKERWGEQLAGNVSISLVFFLLSLPAIALAIGGIALASGDSVAAGVVLAAIGIIVAAVIGVVGRAASATFGAVLYRYAATGEAPEGFPVSDLVAVARPA